MLGDQTWFNPFSRNQNQRKASESQVSWSRWIFGRSATPWSQSPGDYFFEVKLVWIRRTGIHWPWKCFTNVSNFTDTSAGKCFPFLTLENVEWFGLVTVALTFRGHQHFQIKEVLDFFVSRRQSRNSRSSSKERENTEKEKKRNVRVAESPTSLQSLAIAAMVLFLFLT